MARCANGVEHDILACVAPLLSLLLACQFTTDYSNTHYACGEGESCPDGYVCWREYCVQAIPADAAVDAPPVFDARPPPDSPPDAIDYCQSVAYANNCDSNDVTTEVEAGGAIFYGNTATVANQMATPPPQCDLVAFPTTAQGGDAFYTINASSSGTLNARLTTEGDWFAAVYIVDKCLVGITCYDAAKVDPPGTTAQVSSAVSAGGTYHVVVDSAHEVAPGTPPVFDSGCYMLELWLD